MEPDFSGWATKANLKCTDGRTIMPEAFREMDGQTIPLVWQHGHDNPENVLGHAVLEARPEGMYTYAYFNDTPSGQNAKALVQHKDIKSLSIWANQLVERAKQVFHGKIRELSLVLSGANPGAVIENVSLAHSDGITETLDDEAIIYTGLELEHEDPNSEENDEENENKELEHATDDGEESVADVLDTFNEKQKNVLYYMIGQALSKSGAQHSDNSGNVIEHADDGTVQDVFNSMNEAQKNVVYYMIGEALSDAGISQSDEDDNTLVHQDQEGNNMTRNVFENQMNGDATNGGGKTLSHAQIRSIVEDAQKLGSLKESFLQHAVEYGIENIDILFPDAKTISNTPELVARRQEWVNVVMNGVKKTPFSRIKSVSADITLDQARAKGYVKGNLKKEEWFTLAKRITTPTTIYKKQKLDRDDIIDITDLDVVAFLKGEMRLMLDEEIARAVLIGDGREVDDDDKVNENNIRPIAHDDDFYTHRVVIAANVTGDALIEAILRARPKYRGSGRPTLFLVEELLTDFMLIKDKMGRRLYANENDLLAALRVGAVQTVDVMEDQTTDGGDILAILVNLSDYTCGADRGGNVAMFDDFDIDYNQYKYLIETRMSGALTKFKSAQVFVRSAGSMVDPTVPTFNPVTGVITIPTLTGVTYYNADTNTPLSAGAQTALAAGASMEVEAVADTGYYFPHNTDTDWDFTRNV